MLEKDLSFLMTDEICYLHKFHEINKNKPVTLIDVGMFQGSYTERFLFLFPDGYVYGFEPMLQNFNICINKYIKNDKVNIYNHALYSKKTELIFNYNPGAGECTSIFWRPQFGGTPVHVLANTLDNLNLKTFGSVFLKIDAEGCEFEILKGAKNFIPKCDFIQIEYGECNKLADWDISDIQNFLPDFELFNQNFEKINTAPNFGVPGNFLLMRKNNG